MKRWVLDRDRSVGPQLIVYEETFHAACVAFAQHGVTFLPAQVREEPEAPAPLMQEGHVKNKAGF